MADRHDHPDDSNRPRHNPGITEEASAAGQRFKGKIKEEVGDALDDESMEEEGARENEAGKDRQKRNDAV